jgi:predicted nucleic acid-binding protein
VSRSLGRRVRAVASWLRDLDALVVRIHDVPTIARTCRDPDDDLLLAAAAAGGAEWLVTGENDLLTLGVFEGARIVAPAAFLSALRTRAGKPKPSAD